MDNVKPYAKVIEDVLHQYASVPYAQDGLQQEVIIDRADNHYLLVTVGWQNRRRVHTCVIHIDIIDGKVWVQDDGTEEGVGNLLVEAGIPHEHIVLAFHPESQRQYTEFAVN